MRRSILGASALICALMVRGTMGQQQRGDQGNSAVGGVVEREVKGLTAEDFSERQAAMKRLESLIADQLKQRTAVQEIVNSLMKDLAQQEQALAMVTDVEAQAQVAGLLEMERGLAGWTIQTMAEPLERRKALLAWGLGNEGAPVVANAYSQKKAVRLEGVKQLAKLEGEGADWTLSRLINDGDGAVRAAAMAVAWTRKPNADVVGAIWFRAVAGPGMLADQEASAGAVHDPEETIKVEFPEGEPVEFSLDDDAGAYTDAILAGDVLVHLQSPLVADHVKALVKERAALGKNLTAQTDPDWTLVTHRLVEAYAVKDAVPMLAAEALSINAQEMSGNVNGRPYSWSQRTLAIGTLCLLLKQDPSNFQLIHVNETSELRGSIWGADMNARGRGGGMGDGAVVRAFYAWWKDHHAEYGVKEEPSAAGVPPVPGTGRRGRGGDVAPPPIPEPPAQ